MNAQSQTAVITQDQPQAPSYYEQPTSTAALVLEGESMDRMMKLAEFMASGKCTLPQEFRNSPGDCLAVVMQAVQWKMNPYAVAQKTHFISGKIGYEAQLVAAVINGSGAVVDTFHFEWFGPWEKVIGKFEIKKGDKGEYRVPGWQLKDEEGIGIKVWATLKGELDPRELTLLLAQARTRNSTLWADDPRQQLAYLAQKRWSRLYAPGVLLGVYTPDELEEFQTERDVTPNRAKTSKQVAEAAAAERKAKAEANIEKREGLIADLVLVRKESGRDAFREAWKKMPADHKEIIGLDERDRIDRLGDSQPIEGEYSVEGEEGGHHE